MLRFHLQKLIYLSGVCYCKNEFKGYLSTFFFFSVLASDMKMYFGMFQMCGIPPGVFELWNTLAASEIPTRHILSPSPSWNSQGGAENCSLAFVYFAETSKSLWDLVWPRVKHLAFLKAHVWNTSLHPWLDVLVKGRKLQPITALYPSALNMSLQPHVSAGAGAAQSWFQGTEKQLFNCSWPDKRLWHWKCDATRRHCQARK